MTIAFDVAEQFAARPTLRGVAATTLHQELRELYPTLHIDPRVAVVSRVSTAADASLPASGEAKTLLDCLLEHFAAQSSVKWTNEQNTLMGASGALPVDMPGLGALVNRLALGLFENVKQALVNYWSECSGEHVDCNSRWDWLARLIRQALLDGLGAMPSRPQASGVREWLRDIALFPEKAERERLAVQKPLPRACIVRLRIKGVDSGSVILPALVVFGIREGHEQVLMYQLSGLCQSWSSLSAWERSLGHLLADQGNEAEVQWAAHEPEDDIFSVLAMALLENQLMGVQGLASEPAYDLDRLEHALAALTDVCALFDGDDLTSGQPSVLGIERLPLWMKNAQEADRNQYSRLMSALAVTQKRSRGKSFNDGLPPILEFASRSLAIAIAQDHLDGVDFLPHQIQIRIDKVTAATVSGGGQPFATGSVEPVLMTFPEFALENLSGLPAGEITVHRTDGKTLPHWMTADYLKALTVRVDIGQVYPDLLKRYLVTDTAEAQRRQRLFADQLRLQLPLQALEQKIKGELSLKGYRSVCAIMQTVVAERRVGIQPIVLRPLAFVRQPGHRADAVGNMFVIGPLDTAFGPHVLYRPFARKSLIEFASWSALLAAVRQPGALQNDILVWLSDSARPVYANGGFEEPHVTRFGLGSDFAPLEKPQPAVLGSDVLKGDIMSGLFSANARALIELADRNAVSNAESRWALFKEGGWLLLNTVLPLFSGPVANALWLAQLLSGINQQLASPVSADEGNSAQLAGLLLDISLVLLHSGISSHNLASVNMLAGHRMLAEPVETDLVVVQAPLVADRLLEEPRTVLDFSWSQPGSRLSGTQRLELEKFKIWPATVTGKPLASGPYAGLYDFNGLWLARVGSDLFRVMVEGDEVRVVRPDDPAMAGPWLRHDGQGWHLDLSLHLRGGAPKKNIRKLARENAENLTRINQSLAELDRRETDLVNRIMGYNTHLNTATGEVRQLFLDRLEEVMGEEVELLKQRMSLWEQLRVGDRPPERHMAQDIARVTIYLEFLEGRLAAENGVVANTELAKMARPGGIVSDQDVEIYLNMFKSLLSRQEKGMRWSQIREAFWERLRAVPKVGEEFWRKQVTTLYEGKLFSGLEWRIQHMMSFLELCFSREHIADNEEFRPFKALRTDMDLNGAFASHAELERPNDYSLSERIDVLESVLREYQKARGIADDVDAAQFTGVQVQYLENFKAELNALCETTQAQLAKLIQENIEPSPALVEYVPRVEQLYKKVIRTRNHRSFVGHVRQGERSFPGEVADIKNAQTGQVISSWHRHADGQWVEIQTVTPEKPTPTARPTSAGELQRRARTLLLEVEPALEKARQQSIRGYEPEDIEDILVLKAGKLTALAEQMTDSAGISENLPQQLSASAAQLRDAATRLTAEGRSLRISMIKAQPPTAARISYLHRQGEINISSFEGRKNMSGARLDDFLQEYAIRDKDNRLLWWAHFHYRNETDAAQAFTAAHLKLPEQRLLGYKSLIKASGGAKDVVNIYRSAIGKEIAQRLFLVLAP
ncbi:hypothetical protein Q6A51_05205 [Pseudomonas sp. KFB-139]|uniref:Dermonecrotic toxin N-terminal domain-containing protein n=1 Tax=Pseudomonas serbiensis TaxID=3064350 RepID=A0ABT9CPY4_9PSED|nr:DUF6543 domain-containing protein [Pseudomonas sp. KFB-138]MDO7926166.1 hypothetical protein [Pseudomonas sp. KFB-138]